jgi:hypothetical protein
MPALAQDQQGRTEIGLLKCETSATIGVIIGSHTKLRCSYTPKGGPVEYYTGTITRVGLDLGVTAKGVMGWSVLAPTQGVPRGALAGKYVGASGDISLGVGGGANVLVGGSHRSFALQPLSLEANVGVNLALGVGGMTLQAVR